MSLAKLVQSNTNHGHTVIDFLIEVMHGRLSNFKPCHRLSAARLLIIYGHQDAADFISDNSPADLFTRPATRRSLRIAGVNPVLARLIKSQTDDGRSIIDFIIAVMEGRVGEARPHHRMAAARDLLERGFGKCPRRSLPRPPKPFRPPTRRRRRRDYAPLTDLIARAIGGHTRPGTTSPDLITRAIEDPTHDDARPGTASPNLPARAIEEPDHDDARPGTASPNLPARTAEDPTHNAAAYPPSAQDDTTPPEPGTPEPDAQDTDQPSTKDRQTRSVTDRDNLPNNAHVPNRHPVAIPIFDPNTFHY